MKITANAIAGSLESNDVLVRVSPAEGLSVEIESIVLQQFGRQIRQAVLETAQALQVEDAAIFLQDKGAIECTIKARVETALLRAKGETA